MPAGTFIPPDAKQIRSNVAYGVKAVIGKVVNAIRPIALSPKPVIKAIIASRVKK